MDKRIEEMMIKRQIAENKASEVGDLGLTAEDHATLGSTSPDQRLIDNPGKNLAELMSGQEISEWLGKLKRSISVFQKESPDPVKEEQRKMQLERKKETMNITLRYLIKVGKLSEEFKYFDVDAIEPEK